MAQAKRRRKTSSHGLLSLGEAAVAQGVSVKTLRQWTDEGTVNATRRPISRRFEFAPKEVERMRREILGLENGDAEADEERPE